jgi:hypothetical protein
MIGSLKDVVGTVKELKAWIVSLLHRRHCRAVTSDKEKDHTITVWLLVSQGSRSSKAYEFVTGKRIRRWKLVFWEQIFEVEGSERTCESTGWFAAKGLLTAVMAGAGPWVRAARIEVESDFAQVASAGTNLGRFPIAIAE